MRLFLIILLSTAVFSACRKGNRGTAPAEDRLATLERTLESQRNAESLVMDVEGWVLRARSDAQPADRERVETLASDLKLRVERLKPQLGRKTDDPATDLLIERDVADLSNAYDRAIASVASERRATEEEIAASVANLDALLKEFRVEVASAGVQGNAEVKRRITELDLGRREAADTVAELRRSSIDNWGALHRRWKGQDHRWHENYQEAIARLKKIPPPPSPTPKPTPAPRPAPIQH